MKRGKSYIVHEDGRVYSFLSHKYLKPFVTDKGYERVSIYTGEGVATKKVHRLVAEKYIANPCGHKEINHKDGNKRNNNVENLEWCTRLHNMQHASRNGLMSSPDAKGESNNQAKLTESRVKRIRLMKEITPRLTHSMIGKMFNVSQFTIGQIIRGQRWAHVN